jgi:hypothetical protein
MDLPMRSPLVNATSSVAVSFVGPGLLDTVIELAAPMKAADHMGYHALSEYLTERQRAAVVVDDQGCVMYRCRKTNARYVAAVACCFVHIAAVSVLWTNPSMPFSRDRRPAPSVQRTGAAHVAVLCPCGRYIIPPGHVADTLVCSEGTTECIAAMDRFIAMVIWDRPAQSPHAGRSRPRSLRSRRRCARCFI